MTTIAIIGLGYVSLPLALRFADAGVGAVGLDIDPKKVDVLNEGRSYIKHIPPASIAGMLESEPFTASTVFSRVGECT
jgi:UDP-N-acetyl-D-glucosamine dehydrogenase